MASGTFYPAASGDDGHEKSSSLYPAIDNVNFGDTGSATHAYIRFANVTIPQGSTITAAFIRLTCHISQSDTPVNTNIYFNDHDNAVAPTNATEFDNLVDTTAFTAWDDIVAWTDGTQYDTLSLVDELQEVVNRGGFASGNAVMAMIYDDGSTGYRVFSAFDFDGGSEKAELHVEWMVNVSVSATSQSLTITPKAATVSFDIEVLATSASLTVTPQATTIIVGFDVSATSQSLTITPNAATVIGAANAYATSQSLTITPYAATVIGAANAYATSQSLTITPQAATVNIPVTSQSLTITPQNPNLPYYKTIEDTIEIHDTIGWAWGKTIEDTLEFVEVVTKALAILADDPLTLEETLTCNWTGTEEVESTLQMIGYLVIGEIFNETSADTLAFTEVSTYLHKMISAIADTLGLTEVVSSQATFNPAIVEAIAITGLVEVLAHLHNTNAETLTLTDTIGAGWGKTIEDTLAFVDVATPTFYVMAAIADTLEFSETITHQFQISESVLDTIEFATTLALQQILTSTVEDTLDFGITVKFDDEFWECWVLNTNQFNVSVYSGYDFNSFAVYSDTAFGCKTDGIYKLSGTTDDESAFKAGIVLPETYFGTDKKKRFRKAYFGISGSSPSIRMETDSGSQTYTITNSKANVTRNLYGRQWTLKLQSFDDLDFIELCPVILAR